MACSEARLAANRANALRSTGPKTDEGKEASRRNALRHGLTGAGIVVPAEDAEAIARQAAGLRVELAPDGEPTAVALADRVATLIVRMKRSARHEFAATARRTRDAAVDFDEVREAEAARLFGAIDEGSNRDDLLALPEGVDLLDAALADLRAVAAAGDPAAWSPADSARLERCLAPESRPHAAALGRALLDGDVSGLDRGVVALMDADRVRGPWALDQIIGLVDAERGRLAATRAGLDHAGIARLRAEAIHCVLVDDAPESLRARRYEAATARELYKALGEIRAIHAAREPAPSPPPPAGPPPMPFPTPAELVRQAEAMRRQFARVEPAAAAAASAPPLASSFPGVAAAAAPAHGSKKADAESAPRGRSRFEDRRKRPKLGR